MNVRAVVSVACLFLVGCAATPADRIARNREAYASWPGAVRAKVSAGQIDLGFTPAQVQMTLGAPDHTYTRLTAQGTDEVWGYRDHRPRFSIGIGVIGGGGSTRVGGSTVVSSGGPYYDEMLRVVFERGTVSAIENVQ